MHDVGFWGLGLAPDGQIFSEHPNSGWGSEQNVFSFFFLQINETATTTAVLPLLLLLVALSAARRECRAVVGRRQGKCVCRQQGQTRSPMHGGGNVTTVHLA